MEVKDYLIVYGHNFQRSTACYKETEIECNELVKYMPIIKKIHDIEKFPYIGKSISRMSDKHYRELIYKRNKSSYRIVYYISEITDTIHILYISNCRQNFNRILKLNNYFNNYFNF